MAGGYSPTGRGLPFSRALMTRERAETRLMKITKRTLRKLPSRSCWLVKPYDSSYGLTAPREALLASLA